MERILEKKERSSWLELPFEYGQKEQLLRITDSRGKTEEILCGLSKNRIDLWMAWPLENMAAGPLVVQTDGEGWLGAAFVGTDPEYQKRRTLSGPDIHYMPPTGGIKTIRRLSREPGKWILDYEAAPCSLSCGGTGTVRRLASRDLLHWQENLLYSQENLPHSQETEEPQPCLEEDSHACRTAGYWIGDVQEQLVTADDHGRIYSVAGSTGQRIGELPAACLISIPAQVTDGNVRAAACLENLRVWERRWIGTSIEKEFDFELRFRQGPDVWPEIRLLEAEHTKEDIRTGACEIQAEICVGQETEIAFEICGLLWHWNALDQVMRCGGYSQRVPVKNGRLYLHFFSDRIVQELFAGTEHAMLVLKKDGPAKAAYKIKSDLVENINNSSFYIEYDADPYLKIRTPGNTATIMELKIWGLRPVRYRKENRELLKNVRPGRALFACDSYTVYENCVEDRIYGDPAAWALEGGKIVLSPVRIVEEFCWGDTPWGDMSRIVNRTERWDAQASSVYPVLETHYPVLNAAFALATEIMESNRDEKYALPGQEGLMNAALFQREGEGFGSWVRDTCHAAFRCQNLLAPGEARESLIYISEHGFNNGVDCAAMPAIAAWDYYQATGDTAILYEMLPGIIRYAEEADSRFDEEMGLVHASMCLAQDAFEEPENGGYCLGTEILFALMYEAAAGICEVTGQEPLRRMDWAKRGARMKAVIRDKYWNEEKRCFTSGPVGSEAYEKGWWEATGAEMVLWPRFEMADERQTGLFLETIRMNPEAVSDFGINWYPFRKEKNHFWRACWVSWTLGIASAAGSTGDVEFLRKLIFGQVRNVLLNKSFHEVMDHDTGRAWRWPHLPWHAAGFIGYIMNGVLGIRYDEHGLTLKPAVPEEFDGAVIRGFRYRDAEYEIRIHGSGTKCRLRLDHQEVKQPFGIGLGGRHLLEVLESL